jgi:hypothetical protein
MPFRRKQLDTGLVLNPKLIETDNTINQTNKN